MFYLLYQQKAYPLLKEAGSAKMVLISSVAGGPTAMKSGTLYAMTKGKRSQSSLVSIMMMSLDNSAPQDSISTAYAVICTQATTHCEQHDMLIMYGKLIGSQAASYQLCWLCSCSCHEPVDQEPVLRVGSRWHPRQRCVTLVYTYPVSSASTTRRRVQSQGVVTHTAETCWTAT